MRPGQTAPEFGLRERVPVVEVVASMRPGQTAPEFSMQIGVTSMKTVSLQ